MFDASDQFQQFIASSTPTSSSPFPLPPFSSCLHDNASPSFPNSFEPNFHQHQLSTFHAHAHARGSTTSFDLDLDMIRPEPESDHPWSPDELLALLRIRSTFDNWFPQFTWEHVSRKLAELGFKRSPEECKERFEEESRDLNHISSTINYRSFQSGLEQLYHGQGESEGPARKQPNDVDNDDKIGHNLTTETDPHDDGDGNGNVDPHELEQEQEQEQEQEHEQEHDGNTDEKKVMGLESKSKTKRKREERLEVLKGFCEDLVRKMVAQQEEMHQKLLQDMVKRDEEMVCREEAWKRQEMDKMNKELEIRAQEQSIAGLRQASIIHFLNKYTPPSHQLINPSNNPNPNSPTQLVSQTPDSETSLLSTGHADQDGKRWPRDQVVALINLRASHYNNVNAQECEGGREGKAPLWERISQGMKELGYKRSAKRCKEKWENINKYFRKTKNASKNRSLDSRTCPYFHHLTALYNKGTFPGTPENHDPPPENHSSLPDTERGEQHMVQAASDMDFI